MKDPRIKPFANLRGANLRNANLRGANLCGANLHSANLYRANLYRADLYGANLRGANLRSAYLRSAYLRSADLRSADLRGAKGLEETYVAPETGSFDAWKKCRDGVIVKLRIPADAKRSNATGRKCRASHVEVIEVMGAAAFGISIHCRQVRYAAGETVYCDSWNEDRWTDCGGGIHFFMTRAEAENY